VGEKIHCDTHGASDRTFVCKHLAGDAVALGFNRGEPTAENPFPDAWCDDCELIRAAHDGWNKESERLVKITLLCSGCYERARMRNTRTSFTLADLAGMRWKCSHCEEWHTGACLDFGYDWPDYWRKEYDDATQRQFPLAARPNTFRNENYCAINDEDFFVRGLIHLPIIGTAETFRWGVWGSLSRANFEKLLELDSDFDVKRDSLPLMFSWLSNRIAEYPDTMNLKMHAHIQKPGDRPNFELELTDHPLSREFHRGITPERVKQIMFGPSSGLRRSQ
jgi:hypothetical protein